MKTNLRLATAACATVVALGMVGCGGGGAPATPPPAPPAIEGVPAYATPVDVNETKAKKVLRFMDNGGFIENSADATQSSKLEKAKGRFFGPYMVMKIFNRMFENFLYFGGKDVKYATFGMEAAHTDGGESSFTQVCAYSGSFTLERKWDHSDGPDFDKFSNAMKVTFDNCLHNAPLLEDAMSSFQADDYKVLYNGILFMTEMDENTGIAGRDIFTFDAKKLTEKVTNHGVNVFTFDVDGIFGVVSEGSIGFERASFDMNGSMNVEEFDENGTTEYKLKFEGTELAMETKYIHYSGDLRKRNFTMDGYMSMAETNSSGDVSQLYVYGKDIAVDSVKDYSPASGHITSNTFSGTLGLPCLSGAVDIATATTWETNSTQDDLAGNTGRTPFVGTTTISGANDTVATVSFHQNSATPKASYGSISIDGVTVDYDTLGDMTENCDMTLINP